MNPPQLSLATSLIVNKAQKVITHIDVDISEYRQTTDECRHVTLVDSGSGNRLFSKGFHSAAKLQVKFYNCHNATVFLGEQFKGNMSIFINGDNSIVYIGNKCSFTNLSIRSTQENDNIFIGNTVTTTGSTTLVSGGECKTKPSIVVGDDCMFSFDIMLRNNDAHPIYNVETMEVLNDPKSGILIEPHVWIGQHTTLLKDITVGACSIIALGSIVTKDVPRFSVASGTPAKCKINKDNIWTRNHSQRSLDTAKHYRHLYL